jgi:hypothetical protein
MNFIPNWTFLGFQAPLTSPLPELNSVPPQVRPKAELLEVKLPLHPALNHCHCGWLKELKVSSRN